MTKVRAGATASAPLIDECPREHGLWFDRHELPEVLEQGHFDKNKKIRNLLADMFALKNTPD